MVAAIILRTYDMYDDTYDEKVLDTIPIEQIKSIKGDSIADMGRIIITKSDGRIYTYTDDFDNHYRIDFFV